MSARESRRFPLSAAWVFATLGAAACGGGDGGAPAGSSPDVGGFAPMPDAEHTDASGGAGGHAPDAASPRADAGSPPDGPPPAQPPCVADADCAREAYCTDGVCLAGCRTMPDDCRTTPAGVPTRCNPETRRCEGGASSPDGCVDDAGCAAGRYCDASGDCVPGCRPTPGDCGPFDQCDAETRTCRAPVCSDDADCPLDTACDRASSACVPGCRADAECGPGARCDATHACRSDCAGDANCRAGEYCDLFAGTCRVQCALPDHQGCRPEEACDSATRRCVEACRDDGAEAGAGNDTLETASPLPTAADANRPGVRSGAVVGRVMCPGDPDFLAIALPGPARTEVTLTWDTGPGDLRLALTDALGRPLATADGTSPLRLHSSALGAPPGPAELRVEIGGAEALAGPAIYTVSARTADPATGCFPDGSDPQDDRAAFGRPAGLRAEARAVERFTGNLCRGDVDWICLDVEANDGFTATLEVPAAAEALALSLHSANTPDDPALVVGVPVDDVPTARRLVVTPGAGALENGRYCLRVAVPEGADTQTEDWRVTLETIRSPFRCGDPAEPNDAPGAATPLDDDGPLADPAGRLPVGLPLAYPEALRLCPGDADLFRVDADAGDVLRAWIEGPAALGAPEVAWLDAAGRQRGDLGTVTPADAPSPIAALTVAATPGRFYVRVRGDAAGGGPYTLFVRRDAAALGCDADFQEPRPRNDGPDDALSLVGPRADRTSVTNARLCNALPGTTDEDWYRFELASPGERLCIASTFRQRDGNVDLELFRVDPDAAPCNGACDGGHCIEGRCVAATAAARTRHDGEMIALDGAVTVPGAHYLRVFSQDGEQNAYDLAVTRTAAAGLCEPDFRERDRPNDTIEGATPLGAGRAHVCDAWLCRDERQTGDWFRIQVPAGEDRTVHVGFDGLADGTVALTVLDPADPEAGETFVAYGDTLSQCLNLRGGPETTEVAIGLTAVRFENDADMRLDYTLQIAPTNLAASPRGECDGLSGGLYREIPWPTRVLGR